MMNVTQRHSIGSSLLIFSAMHKATILTVKALRKRRAAFVAVMFLAGLTVMIPSAFAQGGPHIAAVDPTSAKVNDSVTLTGTNLGKGSVVGVFLSDDKNDYKATLVDQSAEKIVIKVPQVKAGGYNVSVQVGGQLLILPVKITIAD